MSADNFIKCRFCGWTTRKWGRKSNPAKAFARLAAHIEDAHPDEVGRIITASGRLDAEPNEGDMYVV